MDLETKQLRGALHAGIKSGTVFVDGATRDGLAKTLEPQPHLPATTFESETFPIAAARYPDL